MTTLHIILSPRASCHISLTQSVTYNISGCDRERSDFVCIGSRMPGEASWLEWPGCSKPAIAGLGVTGLNPNRQNPDRSGPVIARNTGCVGDHKMVAGEQNQQ
jgi:hypothetical protein